MVLGLLIIGVLLGPVLNYCIYSFAYFPRPFSPWQRAPEGIVRKPLHFTPILGWLTRFGECSVHGRIFWLRPFFIELLTPAVLIALYQFVTQGRTLPLDAMGNPTAIELIGQFVSFAVLIAFMVIATFIDFDERTIPDWVTIPGTILGILGATWMPGWRLFASSSPVFPAVKGSLIPLNANSPEAWYLDWNQGGSGAAGLWIALVAWTAWCFGLADRRWITRRGLKKACIYFCAALQRSGATKMLLAIWVIGTIYIVGCYFGLKDVQWEGLLSSLIGIGLGGLLVWGFRIVSGWAMQQEALGFGDVTLMAMVGAFLGWQPVWIAFFAAPFIGLIFVIVLWLVTGDNATPFGPYLCGGTLYVMLDWPRIWDQMTQFWVISPSQILPIFITLLAALGAILWITRMVKMTVLSADR